MIKAQHNVLLAFAAFFIEIFLGIRYIIRSTIATFGGLFLLLLFGSIFYYFSSGKTVVETAYEPSKQLINYAATINFDPDALLEKATIVELMNKYCSANNIETLPCKCTIIPAYQDFSSRFTPSEIGAMKDNRPKMLYETANSIKNTNDNMRNCMVEQKDKAVNYWQKMRRIYELLQQ